MNLIADKTLLQQWSLRWHYSITKCFSEWRKCRRRKNKKWQSQIEKSADSEKSANSNFNVKWTCRINNNIDIRKWKTMIQIEKWCYQYHSVDYSMKRKTSLRGLNSLDSFEIKHHQRWLLNWEETTQLKKYFRGMDFNHKIVTVKFLFLGVRMSSIIQTRVFWREFQYERETWFIVLHTYQEWQFHCFSYLKVFGKESYKISWSSKDVEYSFDNLRRRRMLKPENSNEEVKAIDSKSFRNVRYELILVQIQKISSGLKVKNSDFKIAIIINGRDLHHQQ